MNATRQHVLRGLEPNNLLAFLALLGLLRTLEAEHPSWLPRVAWTVDAPPLRPAMILSEPVTQEAVVANTGSGLETLALRHEFKPLKDLKLHPQDATGRLHHAARSDRYTADLWASLISDAAVREQDKNAEVEPTPLCLMFGQGHQHFLDRLQSVPRETKPIRRNKTAVSEMECLTEALFSSWERPDSTQSFRWDPYEDVRYALRATDPTDRETKETTQHGANRLAAVGLSVLTVVPRRHTGGIRLDVIGGDRDESGKFVFTWPIWREPVSLAAIRSMLGFRRLKDDASRAALGIVDLRRVRRISAGKFMNFTSAESVLPH